MSVLKSLGFDVMVEDDLNKLEREARELLREFAQDEGGDFDEDDDCATFTSEDMKLRIYQDVDGKFPHYQAVVERFGPRRFACGAAATTPKGAAENLLAPKVTQLYDAGQRRKQDRR